MQFPDSVILQQDKGRAQTYQGVRQKPGDGSLSNSFAWTNDWLVPKWPMRKKIENMTEKDKIC